jgi:hypothetical protein
MQMQGQVLRRVQLHLLLLLLLPVQQRCCRQHWSARWQLWRCQLLEQTQLLLLLLLTLL